MDGKEIELARGLRLSARSSQPRSLCILSLPVPSHSTPFSLQSVEGSTILRLQSDDSTNRLTLSVVEAVTKAILDLAQTARPLIITGNQQFFSAGADLNEIAALSGADAYEFSRKGQTLMNAIEQFPAPVYAAIDGYCMGGGLDLALACHRRIASPHAVFGHRGAALGLITGWGGTQRLPRLVGKGRCLEMLLVAERLPAREALRLELIDAIAEPAVEESVRRICALTHV